MSIVLNKEGWTVDAGQCADELLQLRTKVAKLELLGMNTIDRDAVIEECARESDKESARSVREDGECACLCSIKIRALKSQPAQPAAAPCRECEYKQAKIDALMLEYCPDEMTPEQIEEWERNQRPVTAAEGLDMLAETANIPAKNCKYCDGTGDVHDMAGEWRGTCTCEAGKRISAPDPRDEIIRKQAEALGVAPPLADGETYIGVIGDAAGNLHHVVLLPGDNDNASWKKQMAWAKDLGGDLPNKLELAMLFAHARNQFKPDWYWSNQNCVNSEGKEETAYAWYQTFDYGDQSGGHKVNNYCRARAVRRFPI